MPANYIKSNRHLMTFFAILIILMMAFLTTLFLMLTGEPSLVVLHAKPLKSSNPEYSRPQDPTIFTFKSTVFPIVFSTNVTTKKPRNVCESPECITLAHQLHNWRDPSLDPCQDFYKATCGKYNEHTIVKGARINKKNEIVGRLIKEFLLKNQSSTSKSENVMKMAYGKCEEYWESEDSSNQTNKRWREAFEVIQKVGPFPLLDRNWNDLDFDLNDMLSKMAELGTPFFGFFQIGLELSETRKLEVIPYGTYKRYGDQFKEYLGSLLQMNDIQPDDQLMKDDFRGIEELENELAEISSNQDFEIEEVMLSELQAQIPSVDFERLIKSWMNPSKKEETWDKIKDKIITRRYPVFFKKARNLETILKFTSHRTLANFLILQLIGFWSEAPVTDCASKVSDDFPLAALRVFARNHFDKENLHITTEMVGDFKESFIEIMQQSTWLHNETKKNAIRKIEMIETMIGYPEELEVPGALDKTFETLDLSPTDSYFTHSTKIARFKIGQMIYYVTSVLPILSKKKLLTANASYNLWRNWLSVNVPFLDDPMLDSTYPEYAKIASIGGVIGHEIGHGFDPYGRKRDENGKERDWWTPEDSEEYSKRMQCFMKDYNEYDDPTYGKNLDGSRTIRENIADIIGADISWRTYKKLDLSNEPSIIGFEDYSIDKLFFQLTALNWCSPRDTLPLKSQLRRVHPTNNFRVNGVFSNMKSFAETFNCPVGTPMNPEKKCELF